MVDSSSHAHSGGLPVAVAGSTELKPFQPNSKVSSKFARRPFVYQVDPSDNSVVSKSGLALDAHGLFSMCPKLLQFSFVLCIPTQQTCVKNCQPYGHCVICQVHMTFSLQHVGW